MQAKDRKLDPIFATLHERRFSLAGTTALNVIGSHVLFLSCCVCWNEVRATKNVRLVELLGDLWVECGREEMSYTEEEGEA